MNKSGISELGDIFFPCFYVHINEHSSERAYGLCLSVDVLLGTVATHLRNKIWGHVKRNHH